MKTVALTSSSSPEVVHLSSRRALVGLGPQPPLHGPSLLLMVQKLFSWHTVVSGIGLNIGVHSVCSWEGVSSVSAYTIFDPPEVIHS